MKSLLLILISLITVSALADNNLTRWSRLMKIVQKEIKILEKSKGKRPRLEYRLLELYTERLKLVQEKNNREFLEASKTGKLAKKKKQYFKETRSHHRVAQNYGLWLLKHYKRHPFHTEIAFNIGLNSRDYGNNEFTERMLLESIRTATSQKKNKRKRMAEAALAEFYYNGNKYPEAAKYYEKLIENKKDSWLPKYAYNLSWCYLNQTHFDKALDMMAQAIKYNSNPKYIKIADEMLLALASFYTYAGRPLEAMNLFLENIKDPVTVLLALSVKTAEKGLSKETEIILAEAQKRVIQDKSYQNQEDVYHTYLDYYRQYARFKEHATVSAKLSNYYVKVKASKKSIYKSERKDEAITKLRSMAGFTQIKLTKDMKENQTIAYNEEELSRILDYYQYLIAIDPNNKAEYLYYQGETNYSVGRLEAAAVSYSSAIKEAKRTKNMALAEKAVYSLIDLTAQEKLNKELNRKYMISAFTTHIKLWPKHEKSKIIFGRLFEVFHQQKLDKKSTGVMLAYNKAFPGEVKDQQAMMTKVLDQYLEKKDTAKFSAWLSRFKKGFLSYDQATIFKMETALANLLFNDYQKMAKSGDKLGAAEGFQEVYESKLHSPSIKGQAALLASMAYLEHGDTVKSYDWQLLAMNQMDKKELEKHRKELVTIVERTYKLQDFQTAFKLSNTVLKKYCHMKDKTQTRFYEVAVMTGLIEGKISEVEEIVDKQSKCINSPESRDIAQSEIYQAYENKSDLNALKKFVHKNPGPKMLEAYRHTLHNWYWETSDTGLKKQVLKEFEGMNHPETDSWAKEIHLYGKARDRLHELSQVVIWKNPKFNPEAFNAALEKHLLDYQKFKTDYQSLTQSTQLNIVFHSSRLFSDLYARLGSKIEALAPAGMDQATMKEFKAAMKQLGAQFIAASKEYDKELKKAFRKQKNLITSVRTAASIEDIEIPIFSYASALTMDKGAGQ